jgi:D-glycerate 3-kinase
MLGFRPLPPSAPSLQSAPGLEAVNSYLGQYARWHDLVDAWVVLQVRDVEQVYAWRLEAERCMRERSGEGASLSDEEVADFVSRFLPAYRAFLRPSLYGKGDGDGDGRVEGKPTLRFLVDAKRRPVPFGKA